MHLSKSISESGSSSVISSNNIPFWQISSTSKPRSAHFFAIERALVLLYIIKGAEPASKAKASSHLKVNPLSGLTLIILKRIAELPTASAISLTWSSLYSFLSCLTICSACSFASSSKSSMNTTLPFLVDIFPSGSLMNE